MLFPNWKLLQVLPNDVWMVSIEHDALLNSLKIVVNLLLFSQRLVARQSAKGQAHVGLVGFLVIKTDVPWRNQARDQQQHAEQAEAGGGQQPTS